MKLVLSLLALIAGIALVASLPVKDAIKKEQEVVPSKEVPLVVTDYSSVQQNAPVSSLKTDLSKESSSSEESKESTLPLAPIFTPDTKEPIIRKEELSDMKKEEIKPTLELKRDDALLRVGAEKDQIIPEPVQELSHEKRPIEGVIGDLKASVPSQVAEEVHPHHPLHLQGQEVVKEQPELNQVRAGGAEIHSPIAHVEHHPDVNVVRSVDGTSANSIDRIDDFVSPSHPVHPVGSQAPIEQVNVVKSLPAIKPEGESQEKIELKKEPVLEAVKPVESLEKKDEKLPESAERVVRETEDKLKEPMAELPKRDEEIKKPEIFEEKLTKTEEKPLEKRFELPAENKLPLDEKRPEILAEKRPELLAEKRPDEKLELLEKKPELKEEKRPEMLEKRPEMLEKRPEMIEKRPEMLESRPEMLEKRPEMFEKRPEMLETRPTLKEEKLPEMIAERMPEEKKEIIAEKIPELKREPEPIMLEKEPAKLDEKRDDIKRPEEKIELKLEETREKLPIADEKRDDIILAEKKITPELKLAEPALAQAQRQGQAPLLAAQQSLESLKRSSLEKESHEQVHPNLLASELSQAKLVDEKKAETHVKALDDAIIKPNVLSAIKAESPTLEQSLPGQS